MRFTVPPPPLDPAEHLPELLPLARTTTLLYPRSGTGRPDRADSSLGGPLLWPADEPWPHCAAPDHQNPERGCAVVGPEPVALVPVLQLHARDVPALEYPAGADLLQVLWCPLLHSEQDQWCPVPVLYWRVAAEVASGPLLETAPEPHEYDEEYVPLPCVVHPTEAVEYPGYDLPDDLLDRVAAWSDRLLVDHGIDYWDAYTTRQSKVGGYPGWNQRPNWPVCGCGRPTDHLLTVSSSESCGRWLPVEERTRPGSGWEQGDAEDDGHGMELGGLGGLYVFVCRACPGWPTVHRYDR
ncbi:hypothetical protein ACWCYY_26560 [Kitasatospora sp. NPDC001664]|uniref:hypothetical protein n=1 Tax=Kitasatospora albolonga TaxID=68173 RepID=UPI0031E64BC9